MIDVVKIVVAVLFQLADIRVVVLFCCVVMYCLRCIVMFCYCWCFVAVIFGNFVRMYWVPLSIGLVDFLSWFLGI